MTSFSLLAPAIARDVLDHALALVQTSPNCLWSASAAASSACSQPDREHQRRPRLRHRRAPTTAKVLYGYTNLADRNELLRIVTPCWRPKTGVTPW